MRLFSLFFVALLPLWGLAEFELNPIEVTGGDSLKAESTRSILWPTSQQEMSPAIMLPQMEDAINSTSGIQARTQGSPTFSVRGSAQSGRSLVLYDHVPLNFSSGFGAPRIFLPKETLSHLNVVKGPASLFYGSQAMSGAIDFISKKYRTPEINISFSDTNESFLPWREGAVAHQSYHLATPLFQSQHTHIQTSFFYEDDDGQFPFQNKNVSGVRNFNSQNLSRMVLKGSHQKDWYHIDFNSIVGRQIQQSPGSIAFPLVTRQETEGVLVSVSPHLFISDQHSVKSRLSLMKSEADFLESGNQSYTDQTTRIWQNEWIYDLSSSNKLQFFADAFFHDMDNSFVGEDLQQNNVEMGPFYSFSFFENLRHQIGTRYLFRSGEILPSLSTHYDLNLVSSWVSYSEGFRNPSLSDLYSNSPFFVGNPSLEPETSRQVELGLKAPNSTTLQGFYWETRIFHIEYENFIESFEVSPSVFTRANQGSGYTRGFDLETKWSFSTIEGEVVYNYLDSFNRQFQRPFRLAPRHQVTLGSTLKASSYQLQIQNSHWLRTYDIDANQAVALENWQQWNFFLHYFATKKFRISLGLINAFNEGKQLTLNYPEPQRKYWLQIHHSL